MALFLLPLTAQAALLSVDTYTMQIVFTFVKSLHCGNDQTVYGIKIIRDM